MIQQRPNPLPSGYLRGFAIPSETSHIWRYEKHATGLSLSKNPDQIAKVCCADALQMMVGDDSRESSADSAIAGSVGLTTLILDAIESTAARRRAKLDDDERRTLAAHAATFLAHNASVHEAGSERSTPSVHDQIVALTRAYQSNRPQDTEELLESIEELVAQGHGAADPDQEFVDHLLGRVWVFLRPAAGMAFLTSDRPLCARSRRTGSDLANPFTDSASEITLPLRMNLAVVFRSAKTTRGKFQGRIVELGETDTRRLNRRTALAAERYAYGPTGIDGMLHLLKTPRETTGAEAQEPQIVIEGIKSTYGLSA